MRPSDQADHSEVVSDDISSLLIKASNLSFVLE